MAQNRGRTPGFAAKLRSRSAGLTRSSPSPNPNGRTQVQARWEDEPVVTSLSTRRGTPSSFVARYRLRSRSASRGRVNRRRKPQQHDDEPAPPDSSDKATTAQIEDAIDRHQLALKMEMMNIMENHEKEIKFWKNKALKMKKRISQEAPGPELDPACTTSSHEDDTRESEQMLAEKVSMLEQEVENRDVLIDSLRQTMEIQDKANAERVQLLENQLERLIEMKTPVDSADSPRLLTEFNTGNNRSDKERANAEGDNNEVSVLEQLLARVLAEKDKLLFENQNLRTILKEFESNPSNGNADEFRVKKFKDIDNGKNNSEINHESKPADEEYEYFRVLYQMSCKICQKNHSHVKYMGACTGNSSDTQQALKRIMEQHFSQIWQMIEEEEGSISSSVHPDELGGKGSKNSVAFPTSSLARHLAKHCQSFSNEGDVLKWCRENIKVEIQQGLDGTLGSSKSRERSNSRSSRMRRKGDRTFNRGDSKGARKLSRKR